MIVYACSKNSGKMREFALAAQSSGLPDLTIEPLPALEDIPSPEENGATFEENASAKALYYSAFTTEVVLADDSGLEVEALDGAPGIRSARYAAPDATDEDNNALLLQRLSTATHREARFVCVIALARARQILTTVRGAVQGEILLTPRGSGGFGYDPLFYYPPLRRSFAQLAPQEKFSVSHRGHALRLVFKQLAQILGNTRFFR